MVGLTEIEDCIARTALRDETAFRALYAATSAKLFGICLRVLGERAEAEDALQETFIKVWHNADRYQVNGLSPMTWLITIARNTAIDRLRARRTDNADIEAETMLADPAPGPEAQVVAMSESGRIAACLGELEPQKSEAVKRAYLQGETYQMLADSFDVPLNTVRTWLRRSLLKLKACLSDG